MKEKIRKWYMRGLWTEEMIRAAGEKGVLTEDEVKEILGKEEEHGD